MKLHRSKKGVAIAEAAAALSIILPVIVLLSFVILEVSTYFLIKTSLSEAARKAARDLSVAYGADPSIAADPGKQEDVLEAIRLPNILQANEQFTVVFDQKSSPHSVSVKTAYLGGKYGLQPFPNPDPLNLGLNLTISAASTFRLE